MKEFLKKIFYGKIENVGVKKGIGFKPIDNFYIDEDTYLFGFKLKTNRYWDLDEYKSKKKRSNNIINKKEVT